MTSEPGDFMMAEAYAILADIDGQPEPAV